MAGTGVPMDRAISISAGLSSFQAEIVGLSAGAVLEALPRWGTYPKLLPA
jgi:hypothetical protein